MKVQMLRIAGVKSDKEFYKLFPDEESFMRVHGKEFKKARLGIQLDGGGFVGESYGVYDPANPTMVTDNSGDPGYLDKKKGDKLGEVVGKYTGPAAGIIQGFEQLKAEKEQLASARQWQGVSDVSLQASRTREEQPQRRYVRPEDTVNTGEEFFPIYGVGTNVLAKNGRRIPEAGNGMMDAIGDFGDMGGADMAKNIITGIGGENAGGSIGGTLGGTVGSIFGPAGKVIGQIGGQFIGGLLDRNPARIKTAQEATNRNINGMMFNQGMQNTQGQFGSYMENGGQTMNGDLQVYNGGYAEPMSSNPYLPDGGETVMFRGKDHNQGGINVSYGKNPVEVEGGEPAVKLEDGGGADNLVVFGNLKIPKGMLDDPKAKNRKFKNYIADLSKTEEMQNKLVDNSMKKLEDLNGQTSFDKLELESLKANVMGANMKLKDIADKKNRAAQLQQAINDTAEEYGLVADNLAQGKIKKARVGGHFTTAKGGVTQGGDETLNKKDYDYLSDLYDKAKIQGRGPIVEQFQKEFSLIAPNVAKRVLAQHPVTNYGKEKGTTNTDLASNYDSIFGPRTEAYRAAMKTETSAPLVGMQPKFTPISLSPKVTQELAPTEPYEAPPQNRSWWQDLYNEALPFLRPSDKEPLDPNQLAGEMFAMSQNQLEPVQAQGYQPELDVPYDISYQDIMNENQADYRSSQRMAGYNPAMQANLNAQKYQANQKVLGEQFRQNQAMKDKVYSQNRSTINDAKLKNMAINDNQYTRQAEARTNTKNIAQAAINSISDKYAKNQLENRTLQTYENLYNYRYDGQGRAVNMNPLFQPNVEMGQSSSRNYPTLPNDKEYWYDENGVPVAIRSDRRSPVSKATVFRSSKSKSSNGSIIKAIREL